MEILDCYEVDQIQNYQAKIDILARVFVISKLTLFCWKFCCFEARKETRKSGTLATKNLELH